MISTQNKPQAAQYAAKCKAKFIGNCPVPGALSENLVLECVRTMIKSHEECPKKGRGQARDWTVIIEGNELKWLVETREYWQEREKYNNHSNEEGDLESTSPGIEESSLEPRTRTGSFWPSLLSSPSESHPLLNYGGKVSFSRVLFCYLDSQFPNVITWVLTNNQTSNTTNNLLNLLNFDERNNGAPDSDTALNNVINRQANDNNFSPLETEALVFECLNENDASHLRDVYRAIRNRKKLNKIQAIRAKQHQLQQQAINGHLDDNGHLPNGRPDPAARPVLIFRTPGQPNNGREHSDPLLRDLLERSSRPNPKREILVASQRDNRACSKTMGQLRQRVPALLLQPIKSDTPGLTPKEMMFAKVIPVTASSSQTNYWVNQHRSESEFDTTRLGHYLNYPSGQRNLHGNTRRQYSRSKSVEAPLNRLRLSTHQNGPINFNNSTCSKNVMRSTAMSTFGKRSSLVTRSESLNSEGSSISGDNDSDMRSHLNALNTEPKKSVLKKHSPPSSSSPPASSSSSSMTHPQHLGKKNVTFSAFATIQLMDK